VPAGFRPAIAGYDAAGGFQGINHVVRGPERIFFPDCVWPENPQNSSPAVRRQRHQRAAVKIENPSDGEAMAVRWHIDGQRPDPALTAGFTGLPGRQQLAIRVNTPGSASTSDYPAGGGLEILSRVGTRIRLNRDHRALWQA
jgi:hypothetical protein